MVKSIKKVTEDLLNNHHLPRLRHRSEWLANLKSWFCSPNWSFWDFYWHFMKLPCQFIFFLPKTSYNKYSTSLMLFSFLYFTGVNKVLYLHWNIFDYFYSFVYIFKMLSVKYIKLVHIFIFSKYFNVYFFISHLKN